MQVCNDVKLQFSVFVFGFLCQWGIAHQERSGGLAREMYVPSSDVIEHDLVAGGPQVGCREEEASAFLKTIQPFRQAGAKAGVLSVAWDVSGLGGERS